MGREYKTQADLIQRLAEQVLELEGRLQTAERKLSQLNHPSSCVEDIRILSDEGKLVAVDPSDEGADLDSVYNAERMYLSLRSFNQDNEQRSVTTSVFSDDVPAELKVQVLLAAFQRLLREFTNIAKAEGDVLDCSKLVFLVNGKSVREEFGYDHMRYN